MKTDLFQHEIQNTSAVFGRKSEVRVVFQGDGAKTDHETIWLPSLPKGVEIGQREQAIFRGYTDHEAGHIRHTDRQVLLDNQPKLRANPRLHAIWNALEDVWLERRVIAEYPGARENLRQTSTAVDEKALADIPATDKRWKDDRFVGPVALTWEGRKNYGHDTGQRCLERVSEKLRQQLPVWIKALDACRKTKDVMDLAEVILGELNSGKYSKPEEGEGEGEEKKPGKKPPKGEREDEGQPGDGEEVAGEGEEEGEEEGEGQGEGGDEEGEDEREFAEDDSDAEQQAGHGGNEGGDRQDTTNTYDDQPDPGSYDDFKLEDLVKREAERLTGEAGGIKRAYRPYTTAEDKWHTRHDPKGKYGLYTYGEAMRKMIEQRPTEYNVRLAKAAGHINVVRRKLERVLLSQQNRGWESGHEFGKLDNRRLVQAFRAEPKVYKMREPVAELDTAVQLLVDLSGSMRGHEASLATDVIIVLSEVMAKAGIPFEILGFNAKSGHETAKGDRAGGTGDGWHKPLRRFGDQFARYEPIDMYVFKAFDERFAEAKPVIGCIWGHAGGNNVDGESVMYAYPRLAKRHERRKVLMVLSDGAPACSSMHDKQLHDHLVDVVRHINKSGVECIGIGIQTDAVRHYYPRNVVVYNLEDLGTRAIEQLAKVLVGDRYVVDNASLMKGVA